MPDRNPTIHKKIRFFLQSLRHIPRWVRLVQKTRSKNSHAWAPLRLFYNIRNFHIWPSLIAISFQSQNPCHNKSTQQEAPQTFDLACREGGMTHRVLSQTRFPKEYFLKI